MSYGYDDRTNGNCGVGHRTSMSDGAGSAAYVYDARGRVTNLTRSINGTNYPPLTTTYDAQDRPLTINFPNGDVLTYTYGDHGKAVSLTLNGSIALVQNASYNALRKITSLPLGNGLQTTWSYFGLDVQASVMNRWYGLPYQVQTGTLQNQTFAPSGGYDMVGNPTNVSYADHTNESLGYSYNELDQLTSLSGSASEGYGNYLQGSADIGNLLASREGTYSYPAAGQPHPHAPSSASNVGSYQYDPNGNRTSAPTYGYSYDVENHLTQLTQGGNVVLQNTFDGDGTRLMRVANGTTTHYIGDWYESNPNTSVATVYYPFNGQAVAMKTGSTLSYLHRDQVGSVVAISDASGNEVGSARYWPFGGARLTTGSLPTDRLFTGQIRDLGDDRLYFFKARYYDATIGKFVQPDPFAPVVGKPPSLNRYAYADNNPLRYRDSTGHYTESPTEMTSPTILINNPLPQENKPLIYVSPSLPTGPMIFVGVSLPTINVTTQTDLNLGQALIFVQGDQGPDIFKANSAKLRKALELALGRELEPGHAAHHLIPGEWDIHPLVDRAIKQGWNIDAEANGMELPMTKDKALAEDLPYHPGSHRLYNEEVLQRLESLARNVAQQNVPDAELPMLLDNVADQLFFQLSRQGRTDPGSRIR